MSIDWITVAAQVVNFLVLVWLLKRFLYKPILDGIDAREAEIAGQMCAAARAEDDARAAESTFRDQLSALQSEQATVSDAARREAEKERDNLLAEARDRIDRERMAWSAHLDAEARSFADKMRRAGGSALLELTRKALSDLADESLETRIAAHLLRQLRTLDGELDRAAGNPDEALVTSQEALSRSIRDDLGTELRRRFPEMSVRFKTDPEQAPGLTLRIGGVLLSWTVDTYVDGLDQLLAHQLTVGTDNRVGT